MMNETTNLIEGLITSNIEDIAETPFGEERDKKTKETNEFLDRYIAIKTLEADVEEKAKRREADIRKADQNNAIEEKKANNEKKKWIIASGLTGLTWIAGQIIKEWRYKKMFGFEGRGTYSSKAGKEVLHEVMQDDVI